MTRHDATQMDFLTPHATDVAEAVGTLLGVVVDHRQFLRFVASGWLDEAGAEPMHFGILNPVECSPQAGLIKIAVWFDSDDLHSVPAHAMRNGDWAEISLDQVRQTDEEVVVRTPLPISAVRRLTVSSQEDSDRLIAMMRNFENIELSTLPVNIVIDSDNSISPREEVAGLLSFPEGCEPPYQWDAMRGAFAMATWAVPAIDPWLDILCDSLIEDATSEVALHLANAPWWRFAPWSVEINGALQAGDLWSTTLAVFQEFRSSNGWHPLRIIDEIENRNNQLTHQSKLSPDIWKRMRNVLTNRVAVMDLDWNEHVLPLAITLVLLRHDPEAFSTWREDWPGMPPGAWWTGAALAGWNCGFERLPPSFRPASQHRRRLDNWIWRRGVGIKSTEADWLEQLPASTSWRLADGNIELLADGVRWAERGQSNRGQWYRLDLKRREALASAILLARGAGSACFEHVVRLSELFLPYAGDGSIEVDSKVKQLQIKGTVEFPLGATAFIRRRLNTSRFRQWLATSQIAKRLPRPPVAASRQASTAQNAVNVLSNQSFASLPRDFNLVTTETSDSTSTPSDISPSSTTTSSQIDPKAMKIAGSSTWPSGLLLVANFITSEEELRIADQIDNSVWQDSLARRVQHYGWRYDYKKRRVDVHDRLGPLPAWAARLAERLLSLGLVNELPDQVIVNEYVGGQGISKHIDCPTCFRGPVVTVSLLETWAMVFRLQNDGPESKVEIPLPRASATILDGPARMEWSHEIPKRTKEKGHLRKRRLSVTFRKVAD